MKLTPLEIKIIESALRNPTLIGSRLAKKFKMPLEEAVKEVVFYCGSLIEEIQNDEKLVPIQRYMVTYVVSWDSFSRYASAHIGDDLLGNPITKRRVLYIRNAEKALNEKLKQHIKSPELQRGEYAEI